jgi:steroid delta-isomerase-like uncharacterized protein
MSAEQNKEIVRRFYEQVWNAHDPSATATYYAEEFVDHNPALPNLSPGMEGARQTFAGFLSAFPDVHFTLNAVLGDGDLVACHWTASGKNGGSLLGRPATGRKITISGADIFRVTNGKIVERWGSFDTLGMMQQLGAVPAPSA